MTNSESLLATATSISACFEAEDIAKVAAKQMVELFGVETCLIYRWEQATGSLSLLSGVTANNGEVLKEFSRPFELAQTSLALQVLGKRQPIQVHYDQPDFQAGLNGLAKNLAVKSLLILPLVDQGQSIGLLEMATCDSPRLFSEEEIKLATLLAEHIAVALEKSFIIRRLQQRSAELEAVRKASLSLTASLDLEHVLDTILENTLGLLEDAEDAHIFLYQDDHLSFGAALWANGNKGIPWAKPRQNGLTYTVARQGEMIVVPDMQSHPLYSDTPDSWTGSIVGIPLKIGNRVVGVMTVAYLQPRDFSETSLRILRLLGDQAAIAIENARLHVLVSQQARTDVLSGLPNRRALDERLEDEIHRARRYEHPLALMMIDLDQFKQVNDLYGHPVGDRILVQIANRMRRSVRDSDFLARYGGDEFALVLPSTDLETARKLAHRLQEIVVASTYEVSGASVSGLTLSFGVSIFPTDGNTGDEMLAAADRSLYLAKENEQ